MKIHEYQGRALFREYGIACPDDTLVTTPEAATEAARKYGAAVVVKAQVLVGGRGKAGGVKLAKTPEEAGEKARIILGLTIKDLPVEKVLIAPAAEILKEFYVGLALDRAARAIILMVSSAGGVDIEELAVNEPEKILKMHIHPAKGIDENALNQLLLKAFERDVLITQARDTIHNLVRLFLEKDCSLVEINPYALIGENELAALDSKINFDDNGIIKHPELEALHNDEEYSEDELEARRVGLSFVSMEGDIGCIVNGAGLAMATMDLIKHFGGDPANFLDVGGSSNPEKVLNALRIILNNKRVKAILINIFGGITRCDDIANGLLMATQQIEIPVPMVIRLIGTNDVAGRTILAQAGLTSTESLTEAVQAVVKKA
ncbi:MAG: ADP-forming succinate--CoA ligase subunit beta [Verrucomicrobia bacterium]|nr:ADP-forming succinate--CoA ligase subunit beta [Verrucomicrobiota bacterium]